MILQMIQRLGQLRWRGFVILLAVATMVTGLLTLIVLTEEVLEKEPHGLDNRILLALREPQDLHRLVGPSWLEHASVNLTALGSVSVLTLLTVLVFGYLVVTRKFQAATLLVCAAIGGTALSYTLKFLVSRDRPQVVPHLTEISDFSYPSGHSMLSTVIFLTLAVILAQTVESRRAKIYLIVAALFLAFVVGVTRVLIGVHYPTDVMAGWAAGTVWALFCWLLAEWLRNRGIWKPHLCGVLIALFFVPSLRSAEQTPASPIPEAVAIDPATAPPDEKIAARLGQIFSQIDDLSAITVQVQAGVALGFAFRNIIENYLAGILLSARNPFSIGDPTLRMNSRMKQKLPVPSRSPQTRRLPPTPMLRRTIRSISNWRPNSPLPRSRISSPTGVGAEEGF